MLPPLSDSICTIHTIFCLQIKFTVVHVLKTKKISNPAMKRLLRFFFHVTKPLGKHAALAPAALQKVSRTPLEEETNGEDL